MDRVDALRAFVIAVDAGSLTKAARALRCSSASVTRAIDAIDERLGTPVLQRTTRSLRLTDAGARYVEVARRVLADLDGAEASTSALATEPRGVLTVTAPIAFGSLHVSPIVDELLRREPELRAQLLLVDRIVNLLDEGVDVAVRIGALSDSALLAVQVGAVRRVVIASPEYIAAHGRPRTPGDLAKHRCLASTAMTPVNTWSFAGGSGKRPTRVTVEPALTVNVAAAAIASARRGLGITSALSYQVQGELERGELVRVLTKFEPPPAPVHLVYAQANARIAKVRAFIELATPLLRRAIA